MGRTVRRSTGRGQVEGWSLEREGLLSSPASSEVATRVRFRMGDRER